MPISTISWLDLTSANISTFRFTVWPRVLSIACFVRYNLSFFLHVDAFEIKLDVSLVMCTSSLYVLFFSQ